MTEEYQGWSNYETWAVHLYLTNDNVLMSHVKVFVDLSERVSELQDKLKNFVEFKQPRLPNSVFKDLLQSAIDQVNWYEIASEFWKEMRKE